MLNREQSCATLGSAPRAEDRPAKPETDPETLRGPGRFSFPTCSLANTAMSR